MKLKDLKMFRKVKKLGKKKTFCECCLNPDPETSDGYTVCCNERPIDYNEAIGEAMRYDVHEYLSSKFETSSCMLSRGEYLFDLINKKVEFALRTSEDPNYIVQKVKEYTKGLRREV